MTETVTTLTRLFGLGGATAWVTGAGRGLGQGMAVALAGAGATVALTSRTDAEIAQVASEIVAAGGRAVPVPGDLSSEEGCRAAHERVVAAVGPVGILVNNAGTNIRKELADASISEFRSVMELNFFAYITCAKLCLPAMKEARKGKIINVSSILGHVALAAQGPYASSKGAVEQFTKVLALELAASNVQVNAIGPGYCETDLTKPVFADQARFDFITNRIPMGRWGQAEDMAGAVIFLASHASDYITGHTVMVDGGWTAW